MKTMRFLCVGFVFVFLTACSPLTRGVHNAEVVSSAQPHLVASCTLPLKTGGFADPFLLVDSIYQNPETWLNVYGAENAASPMGIVLLSIAPSNMEWDVPGFAFADGTVTSQVNFGGTAFAGSLKIVNGATDPFTPLVASAEEASQIFWLAQRFIVLENFKQSKIVLEYREPLPKSLEGATSVPAYFQGTEAFAQRAKDAFSVQFGQPAPVTVSGERLEGLNQRNLGNFIGSLHLLQPIQLKD